MKRTILLAISILLILSACSSPKPIPTASVTVTASPKRDYSTSTQTYLPTSTPIPPLPTYQFVITPTASAPLLQAESTMQALATQYSFIYPVPPYNCNSTGLSPNGEWAYIEWGQRVVRVDGKAMWDLTSFFDTYGKQYKERFSSIEVAHWSKDGKYLYFSPCYLLEPIFQFRLLYRLDLETGEIINTHFDFVSAFSADDKYIVYEDGNVIRINEIQTGIEFYVDMSGFDYDRLMGFVWSPDGKHIALTTFKYERDYDINGQYFLYLIDLERLVNDTLNVEDDYIQQYDSLGYYVYSWTEPNLIRLMRYDHKNFALFNMKEEKIYLLEFVTPTP